MTVNTGRQNLALELQLLARQITLLVERNADELHGSIAVDVADLFAEAHAIAHKLAPDLVPAEPHWSLSDLERIRLARRLPLPRVKLARRHLRLVGVAR